MHPDVVRIDIVQQMDARWRVTKFARRGDTTLPCECAIEPLDFEPETAIAWCQGNGWLVRRWPGGARAWKGQIEPVRSPASARRMEKDFPLPIPELAEGEPAPEYDYRYDG